MSTNDRMDHGRQQGWENNSTLEGYGAVRNPKFRCKPAGGANGPSFASDNASRAGQGNHEGITARPYWTCIFCGYVNSLQRTSCFQCKDARTDDAPPADTASSNHAPLGGRGERGRTNILNVRGSGKKTHEEMILYECSKHAPIKDFEFVRDKKPHQYALVRFYTVDEATKALEATKGKVSFLQVAYAKNKTERGSGPSQSSGHADAAAIEAATFAQQVPSDSSAPQSGFVWDETSGYYHDASTGWYFDGTDSYYFNNTWHTYDQHTQQYIPYTDQTDKAAGISKAADSSNNRKVAISTPDATVTASEKPTSLSDAVQNETSGNYIDASSGFCYDENTASGSRKRRSSVMPVPPAFSQMDQNQTTYRDRAAEHRTIYGSSAFGNSQYDLETGGSDRDHSMPFPPGVGGRDLADGNYKFQSYEVGRQEGLVPSDSSAPQSGFVWDETSGYYHDASTGWYFDGTDSYYFNNTWHTYDQHTQQYIPYTDQTDKAAGISKAADSSNNRKVAISTPDATVTASEKPTSLSDAVQNETSGNYIDASSGFCYDENTAAGSRKRRSSVMPVQPTFSQMDQNQTTYRDRAAEHRTLYGSSAFGNSQYDLETGGSGIREGRDRHS